MFNCVCCAVNFTPKRINDLNMSMKNNYPIKQPYIYIHLFYLYNLNF